MSTHIREWDTTDDLTKITALLHAAYGAHRAAGLNCWASRPIPAETAQRFAQGQGLVALQSGEYLGTITLRPPAVDSQADVYRDPATWSIGSSRWIRSSRAPASAAACTMTRWRAQAPRARGASRSTPPPPHGA